VHALRFDHPPLRLQLLLPPGQLLEDRLNRGLPPLRLHDVVALGIDGQTRVLLADRAEQRVYL